MLSTRPRFLLSVWLLCVGGLGCSGTTPAPVDSGPVVEHDAGPKDAGPVADAGHFTDAGPLDAGPVDAGPGDAGPSDAGPADAGPLDAGPRDAGPLDAGPVDAGPVDAGPPDAGPGLLSLPGVIDLPYVVAGAGGSTVTVQIDNVGPGPLTGLQWFLSGAASIHLTASPATIPAGGHAALTLTYDGATAEEIATASLNSNGPGATTVAVYGVAGSPNLGTNAFQPVLGADAILCGQGVTVSMPTAPFPDLSASYTDSSVRIFVPDGYRDRGAQDVVLHFHGFSTTLTSTLSSHLYQESVFVSGANTVLVVPQGPVNAASGNFGKLMTPAGTANLLREVLVVLYRGGFIRAPKLGDVVLTSHSGGYQAVSANILSSLVPVRQLDLFDSIYADETRFESFATGGGLLRSDYTSGGGTLDNNHTVATDLTGAGLAVATDDTQHHLRDTPAVIFFSPSSHEGSTRFHAAYAEWLRWGVPHSRKGPRVDLRQVLVQNGQAQVQWLAPQDDDVYGFRVETSTNGTTWTTAVEVAATATSAQFALTAGARVRVRPMTHGVDEAIWQPSNTFRADPSAQVLIVQGFDRLLGGSWGGLANDFAAIVGESTPGGVVTVNHRAIIEDGFDIRAYPAVIWLLGDQSTDDQTLTAAEQQVVRDYLTGGGHLVLSGSEVGYDLTGQGTAPGFLDSVMGAAYGVDDSSSYTVSGVGPLSGVAAFTYSGAGSPYGEDYPDTFNAGTNGTVVLRYASGTGAAAGLSGKAVLVGFPLELIDTAAERQAAIAGLLQFAGAP
jgi:hypothetical protein